LRIFATSDPDVEVCMRVLRRSSGIVTGSLAISAKYPRMMFVGRQRVPSFPSIFFFPYV